MTFTGWPVEAVEFYEGLEVDNSKAYWNEHKAVYETAVQAPMAALLADLADEFGEGKIFRPYRDVRFSADKTPYKTSIAATVGAGYVQLSADGLMAGAGMYHLASDQLDRYRQAAARQGTGTDLEKPHRCPPGSPDRRPRHGPPQDGAEGIPPGPPPG